MREPRILDPRAFDVAVQRRRLAEKPRAVVAAARQFACQHRLRIGDAGADLELAGDEEFADHGRIGLRAVRQQPVIGRHDIRHARGRTLRTRKRGDDLAIDSYRLVVLRVAGEEGGIARTRRGERGGFGIFDREQIDRLGETRVGAADVADRFLGQGELAEHLRTQPDDRGHAALTHGKRVTESLQLRGLRRRGIAAEPFDGAEQMDRLRVDDLRALDRGQPLAIVRLTDDAGIVAAVDAGDDFRSQRYRIARDRHAGGQRRDWRLEQRRCAIIIALVERVDRAEISAEAELNRVAGRDRLDLGEQALGFGEFAKVRALQRAVQREFGRVDAGRCLLALRPARQCLEKFGGLGIVAAMVAAISLSERLVDVDRPRERAREAVIVADRDRRNLDHAGCDPALAHRFERDPECVVIGGEAFDAIACVAVGFDPRRPGDVAVRDLARAIGGADDRARTGAFDPRARLIGAGAQHAHRADGLAGIAADDRPGAVEHALDHAVLDGGLHFAQRAALFADRKTVAERRIAFLCPRGSRRGQGQRSQNRREMRTSSGHYQSPKHKREGAVPTRCRQGAVFIAAVRPIPLGPNPKPFVSEREVICRTGRLRRRGGRPICKGRFIRTRTR